MTNPVIIKQQIKHIRSLYSECDVCYGTGDYLSHDLESFKTTCSRCGGTGYKHSPELDAAIESLRLLQKLQFAVVECNETSNEVRSNAYKELIINELTRALPKS